MHRTFLALAIGMTLALVALPSAEATSWIIDEDEEIVIDGPIKGRCIAIRGLTGVSVTLGSCVPI